VTDKDALEESQCQQAIEVRAGGILLNARKSEKRYFGQFERSDPHVLRR